MNETDHERWRDELAAYLLGALAPGEAADLERHLEGCEKCASQLEWLRPAAQLLPEAAPRMAPPAQLRAKLMDQVRAEGADSRVPASKRRWRLGGLTLRPAAGLAAVALIAAAVLAYTVGGGDNTGDGGTTTVFSGQSPGVTAQMVREGETGTLRLANLHQLPSDEVLQAWVRRGKVVVPAKTLFVPNPDGTATATIDGMHDVNAVMVTAEPRGGSSQPTSEPIVALAIPQ